MIQSIFTGLSSLMQHQKAMDTTANNIANANTEGYSKQRVNFADSFPKDIGMHQIGTGVYTQSIDRIHDDLLFSNLKNSSGQNSSANEEFLNLQTMKDNLVGAELDGNTLSDLVNQFFSSIENLADNVDNNSIKADIKIKGNELISRGVQLNNIFNEYKESLNKKKELLINEATDYLSQIDFMTKKINEIEAGNELNTTTKEYANELRDKRDFMELKLSKIGNFKVTNTGINYSYQFDLNGGQIQGIENSVKNFNKFQDVFKKVFDPLATKVNEFINGDMNNPNDMLQWKYNNEPSKKINESFINFSSYVDVARNNLGSTEAIMRNYEAKNDKVTKVNLDEEMVNMIRFQRAYEAAAKVIQTSDEMLQILLDMKH